MLVKLLSGKSFFAQIILVVLFLAVFFTQNAPISTNWESLLGLGFYFINLLLTIVFLNNTNLLKLTGVACFYFLSWMLCFTPIALDFRLSASLLFCTIIFWRLMATEQSMENKKFFFDIGILLSISGFFYPPSLVLTGFLLFIFLYVQALNLKAFLIFFIGFTLPLVVGIQILYLTDQLDWLSTYPSAFCLDFWNSKVWALLPIGIFLLIVWFDHLSHSSTQNINKRHKYFLTFLYFVNLLVMLILFAGENYFYLAFLGIPLTIFFTRFTQYLSNWVYQELLVGTFLLTLVGFYFRKEISQFFIDLLGNVTF